MSPNGLAENMNPTFVHKVPGYPKSIRAFPQSLLADDGEIIWS
jgi:hypothetical protein